MDDEYDVDGGLEMYEDRRQRGSTVWPLPDSLRQPMRRSRKLCRCRCCRCQWGSKDAGPVQTTWHCKLHTKHW